MSEDSISRVHLVILALLTLVGGLLRFTATSFGLPDHYRPDEEYMISRALGFQNNWNPNFALYPAAQMYVDHAALRAYAALEGKRFVGDAFAGENGMKATLISRRVSATFGTAGIWAIYFAAVPFFGANAALGAAAILSLSTLPVRESKYATTDAAMLFWLTLTLGMVFRIVHRGRYRDYVGAGLFAGLATATKYPAGAVVFAIAAAHAGALRREGRSLLRIPQDPRIYLAAFVAFAAFFCGTPYFFLDWHETMHAYEYQRGFVLYGLSNPQAGYGWAWLLLRAMPHSFGIVLQAFLLGSVVWAVVRRLPGALSLATFLAVACAGISSSHYAFYRYLLVPFPAMALTGGIAAADLAKIVSERLRQKASALFLAVGLGALLLPSIARDLELNRLLLQPDSRSLARQWIEKNILPGSTIAITDVDNLCGKPQLSSAYNLVQLEDLAVLRSKNIHWVLADSFPPIAFYSRGPSDEQLKALNSNARLVVDIDPIKPNAPAPIVDAQDAYYAPIANITSLERPGPRIRIWKLN